MILEMVISRRPVISSAVATMPSANPAAGGRTGELNEEGLPNDLEAEVRRARGLDASDPSEFE